ncbi:Tim10/DDP family zinc finger protein [Xylaria nigripes]|nr:Tim10/DDP family zinc finger protein [Xylaria nigripes]
MDNTTVELADIEKLKDKDKAEIRQFLQNENQKTRLQATIHSLTNVCFKKCITGTIKSGSLDRSEESCVANCTERFFDASALTMKHLGDLRQG